MSGALWMVAGIACFAVLDLNSKWLAASYGMGQVLLLRYAVTLAVLLPFLGRVGRTARPGLHLLRAVLMLVSSVTYFYAFKHLPLFDGYLVFFTAPFMVMMLARWLLGERVPRVAWLWVGLGFLGVLVALTPRIAHDAAHAALPLAAAFLGTVTYALVLILTRRAQRESFAALMLWPCVVGTAASAPLAAADWVAPDLVDTTLLLLNGLLWTAASACLSRAVQLAPPSQLAPLDFTAILWVIAFDRFVFGHVVGPMELVGAALVVVACLLHARSMARAVVQAPTR
jgi:drug/metabolite transporter (DMT)-like permease